MNWCPERETVINRNVGGKERGLSCGKFSQRKVYETDVCIEGPNFNQDEKKLISGMSVVD